MRGAAASSEREGTSEKDGRNKGDAALREGTAARGRAARSSGGEGQQ